MGQWEKQLQEISRLKDGWYNGEGYSISWDAIENAKNIWNAWKTIISKITCLPYLLQCSLEEGSIYGEVLIEPQGRYEGYLLFHLTGQEQHRNLSDWVEAASFIKTWFGDE